MTNYTYCIKDPVLPLGLKPGNMRPPLTQGHNSETNLDYSNELKEFQSLENDVCLFKYQSLAIHCYSVILNNTNVMLNNVILNNTNVILNNTNVMLNNIILNNTNVILNNIILNNCVMWNNTKQQLQQPTAPSLSHVLSPNAV